MCLCTKLLNCLLLTNTRTTPAAACGSVGDREGVCAGCVCVCTRYSCRAVRSCCAAPKVINSNYITKNNLKTFQHFCKRPTHARMHTHTHTHRGRLGSHTHTYTRRHTYDFISSYLLPVTCQVFDFISAHSLRCCI